MEKKTFIYKLESKPYRTGLKVCAIVYKLVNNTPVYIGEVNYDSASCKGANSEVFTFLFNKGEVTKEQYEKYDGYYVNIDSEPSQIVLFEI
jgi:hypothetical protein